MADDRDETWRAFEKAVNMAPADLEAWLDTENSKKVGWAAGEQKREAGGAESVGHRSGRRIVEIKRTKKADLTDADYAHMAKVVAFVKRHLAGGGPAKNRESSRWRYSLMNWGHDPCEP